METVLFWVPKWIKKVEPVNTVTISRKIVQINCKTNKLITHSYNWPHMFARCRTSRRKRGAAARDNVKWRNNRVAYEIDRNGLSSYNDIH